MIAATAKTGDLDNQTLVYPGRLLTAAYLERNLNGHRKILIPSDAIITPLARDFLREMGITTAPSKEEIDPGKSHWGYGMVLEHPYVPCAIRTLRRDGLIVEELAGPGNEPESEWARKIAVQITAGQKKRVVVFSNQPEVFCCVANKVPGIRAVAVTTITQTARATLTLDPNLLAVEMPGRTFYEIRQMISLMVGSKEGMIPEKVAVTLRELDGHAHC